MDPQSSLKLWSKGCRKWFQSDCVHECRFVWHAQVPGCKRHCTETRSHCVSDDGTLVYDMR